MIENSPLTVLKHPTFRHSCEGRNLKKQE